MTQPNERPTARIEPAYILERLLIELNLANELVTDGDEFAHQVMQACALAEQAQDNGKMEGGWLADYPAWQKMHQQPEQQGDWIDELKSKIEGLTTEQFALFWRWITKAYMNKASQPKD
jgi:hypothetical protein